MTARRIANKGFTLVEILIVVIILGILAAIVIPQFTSASDDARKNSLTSQTQTLRSQVELYKLQHTSDGSELFVGTTAADQWEELLKKTDADGTVNAAGMFGPYLQTLPVNGLNSNKLVDAQTGPIDEAAFVPATGAGFVYDRSTGKFYSVNKPGTLIWTGQ